MTDFSQLNLIEFLEEQIKFDRQYNQAEYEDYLLEFYGTDRLNAIEEWASENNCISSEQELSDLFDESIAPMVIEQYGENDQPAMDQAFNDWSDSITRDGQLHELQYQEYCYVGDHK